MIRFSDFAFWLALSGTAAADIPVRVDPVVNATVLGPSTGTMDSDESNATVLAVPDRRPAPFLEAEILAQPVSPIVLPDDEVIRRIRTSVRSDRRLSERAHDTRISARSGRVTLEGEVVSLPERLILIHKAEAVVGPALVTDRLTIRAAE